MRAIRIAAIGAGLVGIAALALAVPAQATTGMTRPDHVVIVVEENHSYSEAINAPYLHHLAGRSANMTQSYAVGHPSEPNYLALWSGSTHGLTADSCPVAYGTSPSLGSQLINSGRSVVGYFESVPYAGYTGCASGAYVRRHNPVVDFSATSGSSHNKPFSSWPATNFSALPKVALVVPNLNDDMHNGSISTGDTWLKNHIGSYATWARTHNSILIVTFDEDDKSSSNHILTLISGQHVRAGNYSTRINHYNVLSTVESLFGLSHLNGASAISGIWD